MNRTFRCVADCIFRGAVTRKGFEITVNVDQLKLPGFERLKSRASFVEITVADAVDSKLSTAQQAELDMLRARCKALHIQFKADLSALELRALLAEVVKPEGGGEKAGAGAPVKPGAYAFPEAEEIDAMDGEELRAELKAAGVPFAHNAGVDTLKAKLNEAAAEAE